MFNSQNDLNSYIIINRSNVQNNAFGKIDIDSVNNIDCKINVRYSNESIQDENNQIESTIRVPIKNKMFGAVDLVETQKIVKNISCLKDAFVRSDDGNDILNYGNTSDLLVGYSSAFDGIFRSFVDFNLLQLQKGLVITKATIKITRISTDNFMPNLEVYESSSLWHENDITWDNQPSVGNLIQTFQGGTSSGVKYIYCDVTNSILDWYSGNREQTGFIFKSSDETYNQYSRAYSRESAFKPILEVEYYNPNPPSNGSVVLSSKINVKTPATKDLNCLINVPQYDFNNDINSNILIKNDSYLDCKIKVLSDSINSKINVATGVNLNSVIKVKINTIKDLNSQVAVSQPILSCKISVLNNNQMPCFINVTQVKDLDTKIKVRRYDTTILDSKLSVTNISNLDSKIIVRRYDYKDLSSKIKVQRKDISELDCKISTTRFSDLSSKVIVRRYEDNNLSSSIKVRRYDNNELNSKILVLYTNDLNSQIQIRRYDVNDLVSTVKVRKNDESFVNSNILVSLFEELTCKVLVSKGELDSIIKVRRYSEDNLSAIIKLLPTSEFLSNINVTNYKELASKIMVKIPSAKDLSTKITVRDMTTIESCIKVRRYDYNELDTKVVVRRYDSTDINSNIVARRNENTNLDSTIHVRFIDGKNDLLSKIFVDILGDIDLYSKINVINEGNNELNSLIKTKPSNRLLGIVDILPAPKVNVSLKPIQDAYVRSSLPTFNYGNEIDMYVGNYSNEVFRSFLQFDLSGIPSTRVFTKAVLKLYINSYYSSGIQLDEVKDTWYENDITWNNQSGSLNTVKTIPSISGNIIEIDLMDIIDNWFNGSILKNGFMLKSIDESIPQRLRVYSSESSYAPALELQYYDTTVKSNVSNDLLSKIFVKSVDNTDVDSLITVPNYNLEYDLDSLLNVNNTGYLDSIIKVTRGDLDCNIKIRRYETNDLNSNLTVKVNKIDEIFSEIIVNNPYINSIITVRRNEDNDLNNNLIIRRNENISLDSIIIARRNEYKDINSKIIISKSFVDSVIKVTPNSELYSNIVVQRKDISALNNKINVTQCTNLNCVINVLTNELIGCVIKVKNTYDLDLDSKVISTIYDNINSVVNVTNYKDINSSIRVKNYKDNDIVSDINITANDNLISKINVVRPEYLNCKIRVRNNDKTDINSNINIISVNNMDSIIRVARGDINSKITVRRNENYELDNIIDITPTNDLNSIIRVTKAVELTSKITIRTPYNDDMSSVIKVASAGQINQISSTIIVTHNIIGYVFIM